ncbi:hypothetical protein, partial [Roseovarius sp.]|uniref:hypothetical protein n=1 Tax=Roseovarius sp. TaxID=1486281 RepID=UPI00260C150C
GNIGIVLHGVISLAVAAAGWVRSSSPGDYATFKFPPPSRHDLDLRPKPLGSNTVDHHERPEMAFQHDKHPSGK